MTIASKLQMLAAIKAAQYEAIIAKGGTLTAGDWGAYAAAIAALPSGGDVIVSPIPAIIYTMPFEAGDEPTGGTVWYVKPGGTGDQNGTSWDHAFATRQQAVNAASDGDHIRVWEGQYYFDQIMTCKYGVSEYYGFNGDGSWANRHPLHNPSIMDAGFANVNLTNIVGFRVNQIIDGIWIRNARTIGNGGGITANNTIRLQNCVLVNNDSSQHGGGLYMASSSTASNCVFANNSTVQYGGGLYMWSSCSASNCIIANNQTLIGGGVYLAGGSTASNCIIINNNSTNNGGGVYLAGGSTASNCVIANNNALYLGGGVQLDSSCTASNCFIANNNASQIAGGGVFMSGGRVINTTCVLNASVAGNNFYVSGNSPILYNCVSWGGNIYLAQASSAYKIYNCASDFALTGVANWDAMADVQNFLPLSAFPFRQFGTTPFDAPGVWNGLATLGRTEYALNYISNKTLPKLADAHLPAGSPLIGAGYYEAGVTPDTDADGKVRPLTPSIGAYEP